MRSELVFSEENDAVPTETVKIEETPKHDNRNCKNGGNNRKREVI